MAKNGVKRQIIQNRIGLGRPVGNIKLYLMIFLWLVFPGCLDDNQERYELSSDEMILEGYQSYILTDITGYDAYS